MTKKSKLHQVKSTWYYLFWGIMTTSVVAGQLHVANGYSSMQKTVKRSLREFVYFTESRDKNQQCWLLTRKP